VTKMILVEEDGYAWHVPLQFIAEHRAKFYADDADSTEADEIAFVMDDDYEGVDWFQNNMNWEDVQAVAVLVQTPEPKAEPDMSDADYSIVDMP